MDDLLMRAYESPSRLAELTLYLAATPTSWWVIEEDERLLAVAGGLAFGNVAWLGLVATHPDARGRGFASRVSQRIVEWSRAQGCRTVALDASEPGRPVYERLGFAHVGWTAELLRPADAVPDGRRAVRASRADVNALVAFDLEAFGGDRRSLLRALAGDPDAHWFVTRQTDGTLGGYLVVRGQRIGPAAAADDESAYALLRAALDEAPAARVLVPSGSAFAETLTALGFVEQRRLAHMRLGELALPPGRSRLVAQLSYATG